MNATVASHVLGLPTARPARDDLVSAWRRFARDHHPDRCPGDPGAAWRFATGREAFETLLDSVVAAAPPRVVSYGSRGVVKAAAAGRALPSEMRPLHTREWAA
jgi:DnaJ-class molecular chaperone